MRNFLKELLLRGLMVCGGGPVVLAIIYGILGATDVTASLSPREVCVGILSITVLAFIAAGMTAIYRVERLPLPTAILLHAAALYLAYLGTYLINGWLPKNMGPILIFTGIFIAVYALTWAIVYCSIRAKTEKLNKKLKI